MVRIAAIGGETVKTKIDAETVREKLPEENI